MIYIKYKYAEYFKDFYCMKIRSLVISRIINKLQIYFCMKTCNKGYRVLTRYFIVINNND